MNGFEKCMAAMSKLEASADLLNEQNRKLNRDIILTGLFMFLGIEGAIFLIFLY